VVGEWWLADGIVLKKKRSFGKLRMLGMKNSQFWVVVV